MNEIDMYMNFADEQETNNILKFFKCNVRSNNLDFKKTKIKTIIRTNHSLKKSKSIVNPFIAILMRHRIGDWDCLNEKEFFITLNKDVGEIPDYIKFANLLLKYPDKKNEYIKLINENQINNKYFFDFNLNFENKEEVIEYYSKLSDSPEGIVHNIEKYFMKAFKLNLLKSDIENIKDVKNWDIIELNNNLKRDNESENIFIKFEYIRTHNNMDKDILNKFCIDIILYLLFLFEGSYTDTNKIALEKLKNKLDELHNNCKKSEKEHKEIIKNLKNELSTNKLNIADFDKMKEKIKIYSDNNNRLSKQINEFKDKNHSLNNELKDEKDKAKSYKTKIKNIELYYKYNFPTYEKEEKIFGVIHSTQINIAKIIFDEVEFMHIDNWRRSIGNVKKIYIQREGIPTKELLKIKNYCSKNGINIKKTISIHDEKRLIETISIIKNK
ncbi:hypothetical protein OSC52_09425 [Clostridium pasteurianum]|uniref:hypothetical protein n=1 Tax=Clostridium pasteurianum TaxID=1501 RepID=UPI002260B30C|nr:hypothetical protein [Clostridium pasteurianum]UZW16015.1 hypothetical protein OSC52_09425 [Clostridium pasteurianum]